MRQQQRINVNIGKDQYIKVELHQDFELLEVLSLKLTQQDIYTSLCSDYGVVCGRVLVNSGYGVPNAKVSIFIPQLKIHEDDPIISELYPYKSIGDKNEEGFRYNLLPVNRQHSGHEATGTFPDQLDVLNREEVLEVFENYYKYTVKTNESGDFMIWGVPIGEQQIHVDLDLSDMGCFSIRPDDFLRKGYGIDQFKSSYEFASSEDIDSLPQIVTFDKSIDVYPFWGNVDLCEIGLTRTDFDLSDLGIKIEPTSLLIGGSFTDDGKSSVNKNCVPKRDMSKKCSMVTQSGKIEAIRFTSKYDDNQRPILEQYRIDEEINEDGSFMVKLPMNMNFLYTNEYGENDYTNDPNKGIPTSACYRLRFTLNDEGTERVRARASYLVPNIREFSDDNENKSYAWSLDFNDYHESAKDLILNNIDGDYYPQDYFYRFQYGKVYTVSSFQSLLFASPRRILAINDISPSEDKDCSSSVVTPPVNMGIRNTSFNFQLLLALVITFMQYIYAVVSLTVYEWLSKLLWEVGDIINFISRKAGSSLMHASVKIQEAGQMTLPLTIYDTCDECSADDVAISEGEGTNFCKIAEYNITVSGNSADKKTYFKIETINESLDDGTSQYDNGPARHCTHLPECCNSYSPLTSGFISMNSEIYTPVGGEPYPRFQMYIGGNVDSPINSTNFSILSPYLDFDQYPIEETESFTGFTFTNDQVTALFGIESGYTYFEANPITEGLMGYTLDKQFPFTGTTNNGMEIEEECQMYDTLYNEENITSYLWFKGTSAYNPLTPITKIWSGQVNEENFKELPVGSPSPGDDWSIGASVWGCANDRLPSYNNWKKFGYREYTRKTKTGYSEFRDGVFTIVPSRDGKCIRNHRALREWYRRKVIGIYFCGGIVNYVYADNWLSGSLYFFQFKAKIKDKKDKEKVKACEIIVKYNPNHERFYYRSALYNKQTGYGINNNFGNEYYLGHPTTIVDLGPRDEFIKEICTDSSLDPNCSVSRSIGPTSFKSFGELVAFAINYKLDTKGIDTEIYDFFKNNGFYKKSEGLKLKRKNNWVLNGDITQLISINSEAGIDGFDMQNQKYLGYNISTLDPDKNPDIFCNGNYNGNVPIWGPTPIVLKYEDDGVRIRQCLNAPGNLTESSQKVPFYLWNKKGQGFGPYNPNTLDDQCWQYKIDGNSPPYVTEFPLQGMTYNYKYSGGTTDIDDQYLLPPISYSADTVYITGITYNLSGQTEEFNEILYPVGAVEDDASILSNYDRQHHGFTILFATSLADPPNNNIMNPTEGRLYIRLGAGGTWYGPYNWILSGENSTIASIWATLDPYGANPTDTKQILSTPFTFYFGLRPGKTGLDKLIERFGAKGAFPPIE